MSYSCQLYVPYFNTVIRYRNIILLNHEKLKPISNIVSYIYDSHSLRFSCHNVH